MPRHTPRRDIRISLHLNEREGAHLARIWAASMENRIQDFLRRLIRDECRRHEQRLAKATPEERAAWEREFERIWRPDPHPPAAPSAAGEERSASSAPRRIRWLDWPDWPEVRG